MKNEWRKIVDVHPSILYKEDIEKLIDILVSTRKGEEVRLEVNLTNNDQTINVSSYKELMEYASGIITDKCSITVRIWDEANNISSGVTITMHHNYINYQVHSLEEEWFLGKIRQLDRFFAQRKPWYSRIYWIKYIFPLFVAFGFLLSFKAYELNKQTTLFYSLLYTLTTLVLSIIDSKSNLFPYVKLRLIQRKRISITYQLLGLLLGILTLLVAIIGLFK